MSLIFSNWHIVLYFICRRIGRCCILSRWSGERRTQEWVPINTEHSMRLDTFDPVLFFLGKPHERTPYSVLKTGDSGTISDNSWSSYWNPSSWHHGASYDHNMHELASKLYIRHTAENRDSLSVSYICLSSVIFLPEKFSNKLLILISIFILKLPSCR